MTLLVRRLLVAAFLLPPITARAETISVFANSAHQQAFQRGPGGAQRGGAQTAFEAATGDKITWNAVPWPEMRQSLLRQLAAPGGADSVVMVINEWATPSLKQNLEPLDPFLAAAPVENLDDIFAAMRTPFLLDGHLMGVPIRSNPQIAHYNTELFAAHGAATPASMEALLDTAQTLSGTRADGAKIYGLALKPEEDILGIVRAYGGTVLDPALAIHLREKPVLAALNRLRALYRAGGLPPNFHTMDATSVQALFREGLAGMVFFGDNYAVRFNDPKLSRIAGKAGFFPIPGAAGAGLRYAPTKVTFWAASMPKGLAAPQREAAWRLIRFMASPAAQLQMAVVGNGPVRASTLSDARFAVEAPYAAASKLALANAADPLPVFEGGVEVADIFQQEAVAAIIGTKEPEAAMRDAEARIAPIVAKAARR